ncbi:MAG: YihA family ribosome biogenesis GTP-binding protein [Armatimonadetes bacterium]|nr:YihA family ribosome biogenesis GTP-binding protein [Armatimonadota bacterium]
MHIKAEFVTSVARLDQLPDEPLPEIALAGRSNVGKSSLINRLLGNSKLARTSNTPGRTQTLNYYRVSPPDIRAFFLVDMPGYGYAAVNRAKRSDWGNLIEGYASSRPTLRGIIQLIDLRHPPQPLDHSMSQWLRDRRFNSLVVGTKADKVARTKVPELMLKIAENLNIDSRDTMAFSAQSGLGRDMLWQWIVDMVA